MAEPTRVIGLTIKCTAEEFTNGTMDDLMKENIKMIKRMGSGATLGPMAKNTSVNGNKVEEMGEARLFQQMGKKEKEYGKWIRLNGLMKTHKMFQVQLIQRSRLFYDYH